MKRLLLLFVFIAVGANAQSVMVVPQPLQVEYRKGKPVVIEATGLDEALAQAKTEIVTEMGAEEYTIEIARKGVNVENGVLREWRAYLRRFVRRRILRLADAEADYGHECRMDDREWRR